MIYIVYYILLKKTQIPCCTIFCWAQKGERRNIFYIRQIWWQYLYIFLQTCTALCVSRTWCIGFFCAIELHRRPKIVSCWQKSTKCGLIHHWKLANQYCISSCLNNVQQKPQQPEMNESFLKWIYMFVTPLKSYLQLKIVHIRKAQHKASLKLFKVTRLLWAVLLKWTQIMLEHEKFHRSFIHFTRIELHAAFFLVETWNMRLADTSHKST